MSVQHPPPHTSHPATMKAVRVPADAQWDRDVSNPTRKFAFWFVLGVVFVRFSIIQEAALYLLGVNLYLLYFFSIPALMGVVLTGGVARTFSARAVYLWFGFALWMAAAVPFSWWRGNSLDLVLQYFKTEAPMIFIVAGLTMTWRECKMVLTAIGVAALVNVALCRFLAGEIEGRMALEISRGTISNPNDLAGHLILVLPLLIGFTIGPKRPMLIKAAILPVVVYGYLITLSTGSRGAFLAVVIFGVYILFRASAGQRLLVAAAIPVVAVVALVALPPETRERLTNFSTEGSSTDAAVTSAQSRSYLFKQSVRFALERPVFGVGPGNFLSFEGTRSKEEGRRGSWHDAHNSYTQVAAESGIPALILFLGGIISSYRMLSRTNKLARSHGARGEEIARITFWMMAAYVGFFSAITFLNFHMRFYVPMLIAISLAFYRAVAKELGDPPASGTPERTRPQFARAAVPALAAPGMRRTTI